MKLRKQVTHMTTLTIIALTGLIVGVESWLLVPDIELATIAGCSAAILTFTNGTLMGAGLGMLTNFPLWFCRSVCASSWLLQLLVVVVAATTKHGGNLKAGTAAVMACVCMMGLFYLYWLKPADAPRM